MNKPNISINLLSITNPDMARVYLQANGIKGAFVWVEGKGEYQVLEGKPEDFTGFHAATFPRLRDAKAYCEKINTRIAELTA